MGAIYLYDWYSRYAPSHLYVGIICGIEKSIISISIGIWGEAQVWTDRYPDARRHPGTQMRRPRAGARCRTRPCPARGDRM